LWHLAKMHGEAADKATDAHFLRAARAHESLIGERLSSVIGIMDWCHQACAVLRVRLHEAYC
jgi:hypothetical protein